MIGRIIGTYKIESKLGEGGMGAVYKGVDTMLDREVAIKALKPELARQTAIVERFRSEAVTLAKLNHPNIATLYSLFRQGDELYMVLEYVRGETLDELLARRGALPAEEVIPVFCQILDGIDHAHAYGIIHRDIKPANMILTGTGILKVLDFGIARLLGTDRMTRAGNIIGTLEYMAPEQVKGLETDARSDIYALGMMLYEVLTGRTPFETENEFEMMKLQTESLPPNPRSINSSIPQAVEDAIMRAIQKDPGDRFQTAGEFREFLLGAGFEERGLLRRTTGPSRPAASTDTVSPISNPEAAIQTEEIDRAFKETRLGSAAAVSQYAGEIKETRLGGGADLFMPPVAEDAAATSFFDQLTWIHYAGAGSVVAVILGLFVLVPLVIFSGVLSSDTSVNKTANTNSTVNKAGNAKTSTPEPTKDANAVATSPTPEPSRAPITYTPVEPARPSQPSAPPAPEEPVKGSPPARKTEPAPKPKLPKPHGGNLKSARCALTGDC